VLCLCAFLTLNAPPAWSQATSAATLSGLVTDEQNAVIPGAEVRIIDAATGNTQVTLSNETGRYVFVNVTPGTYSVTIGKQGFTVYKVSAQKIDVGPAITINGMLKVGSTSTTVEALRCRVPSYRPPMQRSETR